MSTRYKGRLKRHQYLTNLIEENPFVTDQDLSCSLGVSVPTIRLDRQILGIPEVRERLRHVAKDALYHPTFLSAHQVFGELVDLELNRSGISVLTVTDEMVMANSQIAQGHYLFAQANSLAVAVIGAEVVLISSARNRFKRPVFLGEKIIAKAMVKTQRGNTYLVSVHAKVNLEIVFKAQIVLSVQDHKYKRD